MSSDPESALLEAECELFARYLGARAATAYVRARYVEACSRKAFGRGDTPLDRRLIAFARRGPLHTRTADLTARFLAPNTLLRRRLILSLAILECTPAAEEGLDSIERTSRARLALSLALRGLVSAALLAAGLVIFLPVRLAASFRGKGR